MASSVLDSDKFVKQFYIPDHIFLPYSMPECPLVIPECPVLVFLRCLSELEITFHLHLDGWHILMRMKVPKEGPCNPIAPLELPYSRHAFHWVPSTDDLKVEGRVNFRGGFWNFFSMVWIQFMSKAIQNFFFFFCPYLCCGMDAQVSYVFHSERKLHPEKFKNQLVNQKALVVLCKENYTNPYFLPFHVEKSEFKLIFLKISIRSIVCLNLASFSIGLNPWCWGTPNINKRCDFLRLLNFEKYQIYKIVGFKNAWHGLVLLAPNGHGTHTEYIEFHKGAADNNFTRIDGEPWKQPLPVDGDTVVVQISHLGQVKMLASKTADPKVVTTLRLTTFRM
ncbi:diacylglycerol kinase 5-like [Olea europaea subsp. europaea]|uniref:Diacylglycerol kinase 5-like n=1 Tax=Olea europaea subsp. europaea TaxID=158383 RepID=A0A8S0UDL8_OLEEU|nr:diacylglycerol kinase 5-like [Olea europaea subsp. europaea]